MRSGNAHGLQILGRGSPKNVPKFISNKEVRSAGKLDSCWFFGKFPRPYVSKELFGGIRSKASPYRTVRIVSDSRSHILSRLSSPVVARYFPSLLNPEQHIGPLLMSASASFRAKFAVEWSMRPLLHLRDSLCKSGIILYLLRV